jgi:hypothetical protein
MATKKAMREIRIINAWDYANDNPFITYDAEIKGRGYRSAAWKICWPKHSLSDFWYDHNNFVIDVWRPALEKESKLEEAKAKFHELFDKKFGEEELVLTPFSSWMQKSFVERRNKEIKMALKKDKKND